MSEKKQLRENSPTKEENGLKIPQHLEKAKTNGIQIEFSVQQAEKEGLVFGDGEFVRGKRLINPVTGQVEGEEAVDSLADIEKESLQSKRARSEVGSEEAEPSAGLQQ